jgi:class 3 adenylate cyclase/CHASE2 domain-containing sensor protein
MEFFRKFLKCLLIGSIAGISIALFTRFFYREIVDRLEYVTYYMRYRWEFKDLSKDKLAKLNEQEYGINIIDIDDRSMQKLGTYSSWDRSFHAQLINTLSTHFPAAIVFDVLFSNPEDSNRQVRLQNLLERSKQIDPDINLSDRVRMSIITTIDYDKQFVDATRNAGCVYQGVYLSDKRDYPEFALSQVKPKMTMNWHDSLNPASAVYFTPEKRKQVLDKKTIIDGIYPALAQASKGIGHLDIIPNDDGVIREVPLLYGFSNYDPVYLPISVRTVASLFATPNEEIIFEPGSYIDIGKPFKAFKDKAGNLSYSYPNVTSPQVRAILDRSKEILSLQPGKNLDITSYTVASRDTSGHLLLEMNVPGIIPPQLTDVILSSDIGSALKLKTGDKINLTQDITIRRDSETDWVINAPFDVEEWWFSENEIRTLSQLKKSDLDFVKSGHRELVYYNFSVKNIDGALVSSIPCLRNETLRDLCLAGWEKICSIKAGSRMDFGRNVRIPLTKYNRHIITFFGPKSKPFPPYSYYDIMKDRKKGSLEGKIYIVGSTAPSLFDIKAVPHDRSYPAVEIHASLMNSFLTNTFVKRLESWQDFLIILLVGIIIGFLSYFFKPLTGSILSLVSVFIYFLIAMGLFGSDHLWIEIARPVMTIILAFTAVMAYRYITEEKDRKFLQSTFKQYLSPELIDIMYNKKQIPKLGGEEGIRTAFFTDIQSFSTFSEKLGSPTRLVELLNEYLSEMTDILLYHYGTLDKYEGDAIIAFFGAPMPMDDHAHQACRAALEMQNALGKLREKWISEGNKWPDIVHKMQMRIGINTGMITTGNMGSSMRMNYTMMGDAVNLAARLESAAKQYGIYTMLSQYTQELIKDDFELRQVDKITVVGKSEPVIVYELIARKGELDQNRRKLLELFNEGIGLFYAREWDRAIARLQEALVFEPFKEFAPKGMSPSAKIIEYCNMFKTNPPGPDWDGVMNLTSK